MLSDVRLSLDLALHFNERKNDVDAFIRIRVTIYLIVFCWFINLMKDLQLLHFLLFNIIFIFIFATVCTSFLVLLRTLLTVLCPPPDQVCSHHRELVQSLV